MLRRGQILDLALQWLRSEAAPVPADAATALAAAALLQDLDSKQARVSIFSVSVSMPSCILNSPFPPTWGLHSSEDSKSVEEPRSSIVSLVGKSITIEETHLAHLSS